MNILSEVYMSDIEKTITTTVVAIQGTPVSPTPPTIGQVLQFNGTEYVPTTLVDGYLAPNDIPGLQLWLRADMGITLSSGNVSNWTDQSGIGDANRDMVQATSANQPGFTVNNSGYNNQATIDFISANSFYLFSNGAWSSSVAAPYTVIVIGNDDAAPTILEPYFNSSITGSSPTLFWNGTGDDFGISNWGAGYYSGGPPSTGSASFYMVEFNEPNNTLRVNADTPAATFSLGGNVNIGTYGFSLGTFENLSYYLNGSIAEVIVYNSILTNTTRKMLENYIIDRYGIIIGP
jgi:hypothetical protein